MIAVRRLAQSGFLFLGAGIIGVWALLPSVDPNTIAAPVWSALSGASESDRRFEADVLAAMNRPLGLVALAGRITVVALLVASLAEFARAVWRLVDGTDSPPPLGARPRRFAGAVACAAALGTLAVGSGRLASELRTIADRALDLTGSASPSISDLSAPPALAWLAAPVFAVLWWSGSTWISRCHGRTHRRRHSADRPVPSFST